MLALLAAAAAFSASASNDWLSLRKRTILSVWPDGGGALPSDAVPASVTPSYRGFADITQLVWNISCSNFSLNSTVYHSARTVGERTDDIIIHHHGHAKACDKTLPESRCDSNRSWYDFYNVTDYYHRELGADVAFHYMPLFGPNEQQGFPVSHTFFEPYQQSGVATLRFFLEPVIRTINWATKQGYKRVIMIGKSGGGWTTTLIAALDARVALSFPIAGSISLNFFHISWDFEQQPREANETWYLNEAIPAGLQPEPFRRTPTRALSLGRRLTRCSTRSRRSTTTARARGRPSKSCTRTIRAASSARTATRASSATTKR